MIYFHFCKAFVNEEKFEPFMLSYSKYAAEICNFSIKTHANEILENKYKVFGYCQVYTGMKQSNEKSRDYKSMYWNLKSEKLEPLTSFLKAELEI